MRIVISLDYELYFGEETGTVEDTIIGPSEFYLNLCEKYKIPMVFFMDVGYLIALDQKKAQFPELEKDFQLLLDQMRRMEELNCEIGLHIHPHWEKARYKNGKWNLDVRNCYKLQDFPKEEANNIIEKYFNFLQAHTSQQIVSFRAGGWCIQPFSDYAETFAKLGIRIDATVMPGLSYKTDLYYYDFSSINSDKSIYYLDHELDELKKSGRFTEVPISVRKYSPWFYWKLYVLGRLFPSQHRPKSHGKAVPQPGKKKEALTKGGVHHVSADGYFSSVLQKEISFRKKNKITLLNVIAHPKSLTSFSEKKIERFIQKNVQGNEFTSYRTFIDLSKFNG